MDEELRNKLIKDLEKSGFASEMRVIQTIRDEGWESSGAGTYFDLDANITRTIDVKAYRLARNWEVGDGGVEFEYELFGEVKSTEGTRQQDRRRVGQSLRGTWRINIVF